jgi:aryl-alcohol dehydrogenase-like predicted oxidoreductase
LPGLSQAGASSPPTIETPPAWYNRMVTPIVARSSQARGFFSGRYSPDRTEGETQDQQNVIRTYFSEGNRERYRRAEELARERGCIRRHAVLARVLHQPLDVDALIGAGTVGELEDSVGSPEVSLTPDEVAWLELEGDRGRLLAAR